MDGSKSRRDRLPTFGRRRGHRLRPRQRQLLEEALPRLRIALTGPAALDPRTLFSHPVRSVWLEIGFGAGEHLVWQAAHNPDIGLVGAEPYINGVARLLAQIEDRQLANVRIHDSDARDLLDCLIQHSLGRVFVLFPDPWPKTRHHKRRLIDRDTIEELARVMASGAFLRIASDIADYQRWIMEQVCACSEFEWLATGASDWRHRPDDWPATRYELKAVASGRKPAYLEFRRR